VDSSAKRCAAIILPELTAASADASFARAALKSPGA
jgi:hypothetical protein